MRVDEFIKHYKLIVLFDGVCNLCCSSVQFILKHDNTGTFIFIPLSSKAGKKLISYYNFTPKSSLFPESVLLIEDKILYDKSSAVLHIGRKLKGFKVLSEIGLFVPKLIRDFIYSLIAKYRYSIFGKKESCMIPTPNLKKRFIDTF